VNALVPRGAEGALDGGAFREAPCLFVVVRTSSWVQAPRVLARVIRGEVEAARRRS
jgi:hypothetical protein